MLSRRSYDQTGSIISAGTVGGDYWLLLGEEIKRIECRNVGQIRAFVVLVRNDASPFLRCTCTVTAPFLYSRGESRMQRRDPASTGIRHCRRDIPLAEPREWKIRAVRVVISVSTRYALPDSLGYCVSMYSDSLSSRRTRYWNVNRTAIRGYAYVHRTTVCVLTCNIFYKIYVWRFSF